MQKHNTNINSWIWITVICSYLILNVAISSANGATNSDKHEFVRGAWVSTVTNIDFPSKPGISAEQMRSEADRFLDTAQLLGVNTIFLQVRPMGDAFYPSKIYPWSGFLSGKQGAAPDENFDALKYWVTEAHKRGVKLHAWLNPYRVTTGNVKLADLDKSNPAITHSEWTYEHDGKVYLNPGLKEVRELIISGVTEVAENYDIDGIHIDDYFYPAKDMTQDTDTFEKHKGDFTNIEDWRRHNVNLLIQEISDAIRKVNKQKGSQILWGVSPAGIWANKNSHPQGSETRGNQTYFNLYADSRLWVTEGWVDYIVPQIYWHIGFDIADFKTLLDWWCDVTRDTKVQLYIGLAAYRVDPDSRTNQWKTPDELVRQLDLIDSKPEVDGFVFFTMHDLLPETEVYNTLKKSGKLESKETKNAKSVFLSPSLQPKNIGTGDYGTEEDQMHKLADLIVPLLEKEGVKVYRSNPGMKLSDAIAASNEAKPSIHVSIHTNAAGSKDSGKARGTEIYYQPSCVNSESSKRLAQKINDAIMTIYPGPNRGLKTANFAETREINSPSVLLEIAFHDNAEDAIWIMQNREKLSEVISKAILEFLSEMQ